LTRQGYHIIARNVRFGPGEIDVIAEHHEILVFIEVKAHRHREQGLRAVHRNKQYRISRAATGWLAKHHEYHQHYCRFDVVLILPASGWHLSPKVEHIQDAFRPY
ncbi:MAG: YraN family protein, partial [Mariprofundaceae bacterium]|nr:YraN family protein [Mariprofundaceae bacterium]